MSEVIFISGIDTDAGKSYATGVIARRLARNGRKVITQKFIQTGNTGFSEDIALHRAIMGTGELDVDREMITAPVIFTYPASAQLAARMDGREIDLEVIDRATARLSEEYDTILIEGAGGLMVPVTDTYSTIDYIASRKLPVMLVTNGHLGSINHTLLSLEAIRNRSIELKALVYNEHFDTDPIIAADTRGYLERHIAARYPSAEIIYIPSVELPTSKKS